MSINIPCYTGFTPSSGYQYTISVPVTMNSVAPSSKLPCDTDILESDDADTVAVKKALLLTRRELAATKTLCDLSLKLAEAQEALRTAREALQQIQSPTTTAKKEEENANASDAN